MKKPKLRFRAIGTVTYQGANRTIKGAVNASSVSAAAKHVGSMLEYWADHDADPHGQPKSFSICLTPTTTPTRKRKS